MLKTIIYNTEELNENKKYDYIKELVKILIEYNCTTSILIENGEIIIKYIEPFGDELKVFLNKIEKLTEEIEESTLTWEEILGFILKKAPGFYPYRDLCRKLFNLENNDPESFKKIKNTIVNHNFKNLKNLEVFLDSIIQ